MIPFASVVSAQSRFLIQSLDDSNFDSIYRELCQLVEYGNDGSILLLRTCFDQVKLNSGEIRDFPRKCVLISDIFRYLLDRPDFSTSFCEALSTVPLSEGFLEDLSDILKLSVSERIGLGLALSDSENPDLRMRGQSFCIVQLEELCANPASVSNEKIQDIVVFLYRNEGLSKHMDSFTNILSVLQLKGSPFFIPAPNLKSDILAVNSPRHLDLFYETADNDFEAVLAEIEKEMSMADIMTELGYGCTVNTSHCKEMLSLFSPLNDITISKILGAIARTHTGLEDAQSTYATFCSAVGSSSANDLLSPLSTWNIDVLVDSIKQLAPKTNWKHVMENLDHEGFNVPDEAAFSILMSIYNRACGDPFPLHAICGSVWRNAEGQLSFLRYAVSAPPDVFTFAHCSRKLAYVDLVDLTNKQGNQAWFCLDLLEIFCQLAERGHVSTIRTILQYPLTQCPEVLLLGLASIDTAYNLLQHEVSSLIFPAMLMDSAKNNIISNLWHVNPYLVVRGFVDTYTDPKCLLRILGICEELKILMGVLDAIPYSFSIKLAAIASRKEHIDLEKWLSENLITYKDVFVEECIKFLKEALIDVANDASESSSQQSRAAVMNVYQETCPTFFKVIQTHSGQLISDQLVEEIKKLQVVSSPMNQNAVVTDMSTPEESSAIEKEANNYFHQMFSGQLSIDAMVQMLARFKESSDKREQEIFNCMISNLFEEYKFFPKYPDKQLKLAAVLFGSLIKHQLVTHLALGIALRGVLDALRKSVDSKMFMFGTKALEQFMDRLIEWPQYCNHILQISHLRVSHSELVSIIERALARISSSHTESNGGDSVPTEQQGSGQASAESIEASEASWPLIASTSPHLGPQLSSFQIQQRHQGFLGERLKASTASVSYSKPPLSQTTAASLSLTSVDSATIQKVTSLQSSQASSHHSTSVATSVSSTGFLRPRSISSGMIRPPSYGTGFGAALNIETLVAAAERRNTPIEVPSSEVQDKILFMINNISTSNMEAKANEFDEVLKEDYYPWFAQYMVMKRASIEPNFHDLYLKFFDKVNSKALDKEVLKATYENCKVLLSSELIKSSSEERSLLKNLGSWLGKLTIGRNKSLRAIEIDPKGLIIQAYERGLMIAVIPFTSKVLEPCQSSVAYLPPNPWTMGILSLLTEIYNLPNLKMNLKFDIEVLFKNLGVDMKEVKPTSLLKDKVRQVEGNPDFSNKDAMPSQPPVIAEASSAIIPTVNHVELQPEVNTTSRAMGLPNILNQYTAPLHLASNTMVEDDKVGSLIMPEHLPAAQGMSQVSPSPSPAPSPSSSPFSLSQLLTIIPTADSYISINPKLSSLGSPLQYHRIIHVAMDRAVREIISAVIQRSVTIASRTTKELILKDYVMESDDNVISRSARLMVGTLAGSLAHVTCKEPLRVALSNHLRSLLQAVNSNNENNEQIIQILINDHLDLGCAVIEDVASQKAVEMIDGEIGPSFAALRKQREGSGSYYDAFTYSQGPFARVPEALRPKPGRLSLAQQRVYDDFIKIIWHNQSNQNSSAAPAGQPGMSGSTGNSSVPRAYSSSSGPSSSSGFSTSQVAPFSSVAQPLDLISEESDHGSSQLPSGHPTQVGISDTVIQHGGIGSVVSSFPASTTSSDIPTTDTPVTTKELGAIVPPSPTAGADRLGTVIPESLLTTGDALDRYQQVALKLEALIAKDARETEIQGVVSEVPDIILRCVSRDEAALAIAQKVFKSLYENSSNGVHVTSHLTILAAIRDASKLVVKELTSWVIYSDEEKKFNKEITIGLIRSELLNLAEYNVHLAKLIDGGRNKSATEFAITLIQTLIVQEPGVSMSELYNLIDALSKLAMRPGSPESLQQLIEVARNNLHSASNVPANKDEKTRQLRDKKVISGRNLTNKEETNANEAAAADPPGFQDQVAVLYSEWCQICEHPVTNDAAYSHYISQLQQSGLLKGDDITDRFFRILTELSVTHSQVSEQVMTPSAMSLHSPQQIQQLSYIPIDAYAKLVVLILKYSSVDQGPSKSVLLPKILSVTVRAIQKDAEEKKLSFNPRPYFRLFINWLLDLASPDPLLDGANFHVLTSFANAFHALQPLKVPGWSFAWLELVSHRSFMPKLLTCNSPKGWPFFQRLLVDLFKFMEPYLRNAELGESVHFLYKGTLRVLLVLLHDFPEFLCDYHFSFCDVIPSSCIQMRNVILSAFPRNMRLPDPSTPNLKIDLLPEITQSPRILSEVDGALKAKQIKTEIDEYLKTRTEGSSFLADLKQRFLLPQNEANLAGTRYNVPLINSLVLYVGMQAIQQLQNKSPPQLASTQQMSHIPPMDIFLVGAAMDIFQSLIKNLDTEGRYLFLNAVANQLRYPNNHTHYFSFVLLYLFAEASQEIIQEQITRVLLERLIVNRPHPWGLLITFIELIKNPRYNFWNRPFTRCAPEIEKLFESVSRSCGGPKAVDDGIVSSVVSDGNH